MFTEESSEKGIPAFWEEYYQNEVYKKAPGYLGICAQEKEGAGEFMYGIGCDADDVKEVPEGFQIMILKIICREIIQQVTISAKYGFL